MSIKRILYALALMAIVHATVAGAADDKPNGTITLTDLAGRTVSVHVPVERVVLTFYFEEYVPVEGGDDPFKRIVGWNRGYWEGRRQWTWDTYKSAFPEIDDIPDVGYINKGTFNPEKVISLHPDVVIMYPADVELAKDDISKLDKAGIPIVVVDYHSETLEAYNQSTMILGKLLGREERAQEIMDFYREQVEKVTTRIEKLNGPEPKVYVECGNKGPSEYSSTYPAGYMWGALIDKCRGINVAEGAIAVGKESAISPEYLLKQNPDVIIITGSYWPAVNDSMRLGYGAQLNDSRERLEAFTKRPGWNDINAVKNGRVYAIDHGLSRSLHSFVALQAMAKCLYPEEFKDLDPAENYREFHERFLPVEYSGLWTIAL
ncbi:MAG TPA: ABC transporter substrate-binding protein [Methanothrix sp.]|nr:ABC transporter substrate-binding protein [Methanothrix sp.]